MIWSFFTHFGKLLHVPVTEKLLYIIQLESQEKFLLNVHKNLHSLREFY